MAATFHAIAMLALIPLGLGLLLKFGTRPRTAKQWVKAGLAGLGVFVFVYAFVAMFGITCLPTPGWQWTLPALLAGICMATLRSWKGRIGVAMLFLVIAALLGSGYRTLLWGDSEYAEWEGAHRSFSNKRVTGVSLWHSWMTGVYAVGQEPPAAVVIAGKGGCGSQHAWLLFTQYAVLAIPSGWTRLQNGPQSEKFTSSCGNKAPASDSPA